MRITVLGGTLALLALTSAASANLITNGDFQSAPNGTGWSSYVAAGTLTMNYAQTGVGGVIRAARMRPNAQGGGWGSSYYYQAFTVTPGATYTASAYMKVTGSASRTWAGMFMMPGTNNDLTNSVANQALITGQILVASPVNNYPTWNTVTDTGDAYPTTGSTDTTLNASLIAEFNPKSTSWGAWAGQTAGSDNGFYTDTQMRNGVGSLIGYNQGSGTKTASSTSNVMLVGFFLTGTAPEGSTSDFLFDNVVVEAVPEPTVLAMLGLGAVGLFGLRRRK